MPVSLVPRSISRYLRPKDERYRTRIVESAGSGSALLSSLRLSLATVEALEPEAVSQPLFGGAWTVSIDSTTPTRLPPIRTSLFGPRRAASQMSADTL